MTLHTYDDVDQGSDRWHDLRRGIVTASTVGKLLTPTLKVADNDTARGLIATLAAERITGWTESTPVTGDMIRGTEMEPYARDAYSEHYAPATEVGFMTEDRWGFTIGFSPDGLVGSDGLLEVKSPRAKTHIRTVLADQVPTYYMAQVQTGLLVSGRKWLDFVSFVSGLPLYVKRVHPDPQWFDAIVLAAAEFEVRVEQIVSDYLTRTDGLPTTKRVDPFEVELKLA